jgi:uncharacterized protein involved in exopolysaccharide biosynthesis
VQELDYIGMIRRHARMIGLLCLSAVVQVILFSFLLSDKYHASTLVLITPQWESALSSVPQGKELLSFPVSSIGVSTQTETSTKTYGELIKSRPVIERVVRTLGLDQPPKEDESSALGALLDGLKGGLKELVARTWQVLQYGRVVEGNPIDDAASELSSRIAIAPARNSYVFAIEASWSDPRVAAAVANEVAHAFVELLSEISESEAKGLREFVGQRLRESEAQVASARDALRVFKETHGIIAFSEETAEDIKLIATLAGSLENTQSRLSGELAQFRSTAPKGLAVTPRVLALQAERDRLAQSIAARKTALSELPDAEARLASLKLDLTTAEEIYQLISREYEEARIREAQRTSDILIVAPALVPVRPVRPIKVYYVVVAMLIALVTGVGVALLQEVANPNLRNVQDVERVLEVPVLATLPEMHPSHGRKR